MEVPKGMCNLTLHINGQATKLVSYITKHDPVSSLSEFQMLANAELTKLIESQAEPLEEISCEDDDDSDEDISAPVVATPKKRKT